MVKPQLLLCFLQATHHRDRRPLGFTLLELLVALIIGSIITLALLSLVVELTDTNRKDSARTETQRDMQLAIDFMTQDLREAAFVYDGACLTDGSQSGQPTVAQYPSFCPGVLNHLPETLKQNGRVPVLAFWRPTPLPKRVEDLCKAEANEAANQIDFKTVKVGTQTVPCLSGRSYSLIVYYLQQDNDPNDNWKGRARLYRYRLDQFDVSGASPAITQGYVPPLQFSKSGFHQWPYDLNNAGAIVNSQTQRPTNLAGRSDVLVDFVDVAGVTNPDCGETGSSIVPTTPAVTNARGFYACVVGQTLADLQFNASQPNAQKFRGINQEVRLFLTGNFAGRSGYPLSTSDSVTRLDPNQTRVLVRGAINKNPQ